MAIFHAGPWEALRRTRLIRDARVPYVAPVATASTQRPGIVLLAQRIAHQRERAVGYRIFHRGRTAVMRIDVHSLGGERAIVLNVTVGEIVRIARTSAVTRVQWRHFERVLAQRIPRFLLTTCKCTVTPKVSHKRRHRVAGHDVGLETRVAPTWQPSTLLVDFQQGITDIPRAFRTQDGQQLILRTVGVPQREVLVIRP